MRDKPTYQHVWLDTPADSTIVVHCLVCGNAPNRPGESPDDYWIFEPCSHLAFAWEDASGEYMHQSEDFARRLEAIDEDDLEDLYAEEVWGALGYGSDLVVVEVTQSGMACGPFAISAFYGFDYSAAE